MNYKDDGAYAV